MRIFYGCIFLLIALFGCTASYASQRNVEAARRAWESVIEAKGGRNLLQGVRTLGIQSQYDGAQGLRSFRSYSRQVYEFPSRVWIRGVDPPYQPNLSPLLILEAWDADAGIGWLTNGTSVPKPRDFATITKMAKEKSCKTAELFLLESKWYQPEIIAVDESKWMKKDALVIYVNSCSGPAAYVVDLQTRLPLAFILFPISQFGDKLPPLPTKYRYGVWRFDEYAPVDGIMMPRKTGFGDTTYEINREYPRSLFTKRPEVSDWGPWPPPAKK
jgi:hypothetical protein